MNSFILRDTRTGEYRRYMSAGVNQDAAMAAAVNAPNVRPTGYGASIAILYNVNGVRTYFIPLVGSDNLVKMYAFVNMENAQVVGAADSIPEAYRRYQAGLSARGQRLQAGQIVERESLAGVVEHIAREGETFFLLLNGQNGREFFVGSSVSPELKYTVQGHRVALSFEASAETQVPVTEFNNLSIDLVE